MRTALLILGSFLVLVAVSFLLVMPDFVLNPYYNIRYSWSHLPIQKTSSLDQAIFDRFKALDSGGSYNYSGGINFLYESRHDAALNAYFYKFANTGKKLFCAKSEGFAYLTGNVEMKLQAGEVKHFVLKEARPPRLRFDKLRFYESCGWLSYSGGELELTVSSEK